MSDPKPAPHQPLLPDHGRGAERRREACGAHPDLARFWSDAAPGGKRDAPD